MSSRQRQRPPSSSGCAIGRCPGEVRSKFGQSRPLDRAEGATHRPLASLHSTTCSETGSTVVKSLFPRRGGNGQMISSVRAVVSPNRPIAYGGGPPGNPPRRRVISPVATAEKGFSPPIPPPRERARRPDPQPPKGRGDSRRAEP